jgi:glutamyl-tRNA synthetase
MAQNSRYFFEEFGDYEGSSATKHLRPVVLEPLAALRERLAGLETWAAGPIHEAIVEVAESAGLGLGKLGQPVRVAVSGRSVSPPFDVTLALIGKERVLTRLDRALAYVRERAST